MTVLDDQAPVIQCDAPSTITPPDAPITFSGTDEEGLVRVYYDGQALSREVRTEKCAEFA